MGVLRCAVFLSGFFFLALLSSPTSGQCFVDGCSTGSPPGGPRGYYLSGGPNPTDQLHIDDELSLCLNGVRIFCGEGLSLAPVFFNATPGDNLRVLGFDNGGCRGVGELWIHDVYGEGKLKLADAYNGGCFPGQPAGGLFYDRAFTVPDFIEPMIALEARPSQVEKDDDIVVTVVGQNMTQIMFANVTPFGALGIDGDGEVEYASGPEPASVASVPPGASISFVYHYKATKNGRITFQARVQGEDESGSPVVTDPVTSNEVVIGPYLKLVRVVCTESDEQIVPGDRILLGAQFEKIGKGEVQVSLSSEEPLLEGITPATLPTGQGTFSVNLPARVADEANAEVLSSVIEPAPGAALESMVLSLESRVRLKADYLVDGVPKSVTLTGSLTRSDGSAWSITYPDYSAVTGEPPTATSHPATELDYYRRGPLVFSSRGDGSYLREPKVRKWALRAARYHDPDDSTPDRPDQAAENLGQFLSENVPFDWIKGETLSRPVELATSFELGGKPPPHACIGKALAFGGFARTLGLRVREMDNAILFYKLTGPVWAQHATDQVWHDGAWQWYDITLTRVNDGKVVHDYPGAYFRQKFAVYPYVRIRTWFAWDTKLVPGTDFQLFGQEGGNETSVGEISIPDRWQLFADIAKEDLDAASGALHLQAHSPCTMLYTDAQGRRLGAVGSLTDADCVGLDSPLPLTGAGTVWEVPGGVYIAPATPISLNSGDPNAVERLEEEIVVPREQLTDTFSLKVTGTDDGPYTIEAWVEKPDGPQRVFTYSGTTEAGRTAMFGFAVDQNGAVPTVTMVESPTSGMTPAACGTGVCGAGAFIPMILAMLGVAVMKRSRRSASWRLG